MSGLTTLFILSGSMICWREGWMQELMERELMVIIIIGAVYSISKAHCYYS